MENCLVIEILSKENYIVMTTLGVDERWFDEMIFGMRSSSTEHPV